MLESQAIWRTGAFNLTRSNAGVSIGGEGEDMTRSGVVWILGAGFSKPLGAPLLSELLTIRSAQRVIAAYPDGLPMKTAGGIMSVASVYEAGRNDKEWEHAEEFLERLDLALVEGGSIERILSAWSLSATKRGLHGIPQSGIRHLRDDAVRMLGAEVCLFLKHFDRDMERMAPYVDWAESLQPEDTVMTFNYDRVIELIKDARPDGIYVPMPSDIKDRPPRAPMVLKMHGSVDWLKHKLGAIWKDGSSESVLQCDPEQMALASPGPTKQRMIKKDGAFAPIWRAAEAALQNARAVVFVGYRMPPTDSYTKQWLVQQLRLCINHLNGGAGDEFLLPVHTVLGPGLDKPDSKRLKGLLLNVHGLLKLKQWDMGTEDFLGLVGREELVSPSAPFTTAAAEARRSR